MTLRSNVPLVFVDTETTSLDPHTRVVWEVAMIRVEPDGSTRKTDFQVDLTSRELLLANDDSLEIGGYHERYNVLAAYSRKSAAAFIADFTDGAIFVANQPDFDAHGLTNILESAGLKPGWNRKLLDIGTLGQGILLAHKVLATDPIEHPRSLTAMAEFLEVEIDPADKHTAMGDAQYVKDVYYALMDFLQVN